MGLHHGHALGPDRGGIDGDIAGADELSVERCERRARALGYHGLEVVNLFALRSTDPAALYAHEDPVGPLNDDAIEAATAGGKTAVICAWGNHGGISGRAARVLRWLRMHGRTVGCLGVNKTGHPVHPLYVPYARALQPVSGDCDFEPWVMP